jgi:hypothetical protein
VVPVVIAGRANSATAYAANVHRTATAYAANVHRTATAYAADMHSTAAAAVSRGEGRGCNC